MSTFRLSTLERLRAQQEQICARRLQGCTHDLTQAQQERARLVTELEATGNRGSGDQLVLADRFRTRLRDEITTADGVIDTCTAAVGQARASWLTARARLGAVQALHERHRQALRAGMARQEQADLDEYAGSAGAVSRASMGGAA